MHPRGDTPASLSLLLFGGPFLYLLVQTAYLWLVTHNRTLARPAGLAALVLGGWVSVVLPAYAAIALVATIASALVGAVSWEDRARRPSPA
jgi:low temperature requirement protein LtrA